MSALSFRIAALLALLFAGTSAAANFTIVEPTADRWMYPFSTSNPPGNRQASSVFGAVGESSFDDRDGQLLIRFDTSAIAAPGQGAESYLIDSLKLTLTVAKLDPMANGFIYDPTYDSWQNRVASSSPDYVMDTDPGTPVELFAVGYRNGFSESTFGENTPFSPPPFMAEGVRSAFAAGFNGSSLYDVSNNVAARSEVSPLAIGQMPGHSGGYEAQDDDLMTFDLNFGDPAVLAWLQNSLNLGYLEFMVTSLQAAEQGVAAGNPTFYNKEYPFQDPAHGDFYAPQLSGAVAIAAVPEPGTFALMALGAVVLALARRRHA